jgi:hypothetical protein
MQLTIPDTALSGLNAIVSRLNSVEGAEQTTAEEYLTARVEEILASYDASEVERVMQENAAFFQQAALLPASVQQQLRDLIAQASASS